MAGIGLSKPMYAIYDMSTGVPTYKDGGILAKAIEVSIDVESGDDNVLYADNGVAEVASVGFTGGTFTLNTDDLSDEVSKVILGLKSEPITGIEGLTTTGATELIFDDTINSPTLGLGFIIKKMVGGTLKWRAVILTKVVFSIPSTAATTQGDSIEWQTPELSGTLSRDDTPTHRWKMEATFDTEADAELYIRTRLSITDASNTPAAASAASQNVRAAK